MQLMQKQSSSSFFSQMTSHYNFKHFVMYCISYLVYGMGLTCLGPMFPYLADKQNRLETQYSFLFTSRALGFILGCLLGKWLGKKLYLHQIIQIGLVLNGVSCLFFNLTQDLYWRGFLMFFSNLGCSFQDITINLAAVECFKGDNMGMWLQLIHAALGIGGLLGPLAVYIFELNTLKFMGILILCLVPFYFHLLTPEKLVNMEKLQQKDYKILDLPIWSLYLISFSFLISVGQETAYGGWVSSYAVLNDFSTKQHATFYSSLYWISITVFRFIMALVQGTASKKIRYLGYIGIASTAASYLLIFYVNSETGLVSMSILYGLCNSVLFPLLLTIPEEFGYKLSIHESTTFLIWAAIGDGCVGVVVGKMMGWFSYNWLLYSIGLMNVFLVIVMIANEDILLREKERNGQLEKLITDTIKGDKKQNHFYFHREECTELKQIKK